MKKLQGPIFIGILILFVIVIYNFQQTSGTPESSESFISGTEVQLLTSKPYYTWYDYITHSRRHPYFYGYPYYGRRNYYDMYPRNRHVPLASYNYNSYNRYPYYNYPHFSPQYY